MNVYRSVGTRRGVAAVGIAMTTAATVLTAPFGGAVASADPCPDVEVVFARGTGEAPGVGGVGQAWKFPPVAARPTGGLKACRVRRDALPYPGARALPKLMPPVGPVARAWEIR